MIIKALQQAVEVLAERTFHHGFAHKPAKRAELGFEVHRKGHVGFFAPWCERDVGDALKLSKASETRSAGA